MREPPYPSLHAILDAIDDGVVLLDGDLHVAACNAAAAKLFGLPIDNLLNLPFTRFVPDFADPTANDTRAYTAHLQDGAGILEVRTNAVKGNDAPAKWVLVLSGISQRNDKSDEHAEVSASFRYVADRLEDAFFVIEVASRRALYVSPVFTKIFGRPADLLVSEHWLDWVHPEDRLRLQDAARDLLRGHPFALGYRITWPDGTVRHLECTAFLMPQREHVAGLVRDVSGDKRLREDLRQAQRLESVGTLTSGVAHDFNNLLMGVGGCVKLALKRLDPAHPSAPYLRRSAEAILHGASLTRQITRFSDTRASAPGPIELDEVVLSARELVRSLLGEHVRLRVVTEARGVQIVADAGEIEQILMNLASNARDAMPEGGTLTFSTCCIGSRVELTVSDTGTGMPDSVRARAFEPFFTTKEIGRGTGLGLATVFAVAGRLRGKVSIDSAEGRGTSISISLPIADPKEPSAFAEVVSVGDAKHVLLVENDPLVRMTIENQLETLGCCVLSAESVSEALMLLDDPGDPLDLAIVDVVMPSTLGTKLRDLLRARNNPLPVLFVSAHPRSELIRHFGLPANARLLQKPFDAATLGKAVAEACSATPARPRARVFVVDDNADIADTVREVLECHYDVRVAYDGEAAIRDIPEFAPDLVLCDLELGLGLHGCDVLHALAGDPRLARTRFLAVTGGDPLSCHERAMAAGFDRVLRKPLDLDYLMELLE